MRRKYADELRNRADVAPAGATPLSVLRACDVEAKTGISRASLYRMMAAGDFPLPIRLTGKNVGWLSAEIDAWIMARAADRA